MIAWVVNATPYHVTVDRIDVQQTKFRDVYQDRKSGKLYSDKLTTTTEDGYISLMYVSRQSAKRGAISYAQMQVNYWTEKVRELERG